MISSIVFSLYIDPLLLELNRSGIGCHINGIIWVFYHMQMILHYHVQVYGV